MPNDTDLGECGQYDVWVSDPSGGRYMEGAGPAGPQLDPRRRGRRRRPRITASPGVPRPARDQLTGMVESVDFIARD